MLAALVTLLAAVAPAGTPPTPRPGLQQIFIAPSGEIFRAPAEAPYPVADWFARADADHDGKLTEAEFVADFLRVFASLDLDHDGIIDGKELNRYEEALAPELHTSSYDGDWGVKHSDDDSGSGGNAERHTLGSFMDKDSPQGAGRFDLLRIPEPVASMDTNLNGRITRQEAQDAAEYRFSVLDAHQHGFVTLAELPESYAQHHHVDGHRAGSGKSHGHGRRGGATGGGGSGGSGAGGFGSSGGGFGPSGGGFGAGGSQSGGSPMGF